MNQTLVVLVDEQNNPIGTLEKDSVHSKNTPLHRAFSLFVFNHKKELLITQRAKNKKTFPGVWTNTVCGHLLPEETTVSAAKRRLKDELGIVIENIQEVAPYRYRFADNNGIVENEICPILVGYFNGDPQPNSQEVEDWKWMNWQDFLAEIKNDTVNEYSPWCKEEAIILQQTDPGWR